MRPFPVLLLAACAAEPGGDDVLPPADSDPLVESDPPPRCPVFAAPEALGKVASDAVDEASGLVAARRAPGVWWVHDDSGEGARIFAVGSDGADLGAFDIPGATATDWEDVAMLPDGDGTWSILVGDIGDNRRARPEIVLWRIPEPDPFAPGESEPAEAIRLTYPDGAQDAETLLADPVTGDVFVVTKAAERAGVYRAAAPLGDGVLEHVTDLVLVDPERPADPLATAGDVAPDGSGVLIRTYLAAFYWPRGEEQTVAEALAEPPCPAPLASEFQGEAIAFAADGSGYATVAEGEHPTLWFVARE